jgi:hypothetical protein
MSEEQSHYTIKDASPIMPIRDSVKQKEASTLYQEDFSKAAKDFWLENKKEQPYSNGYIMGKYGKKDLTLQNFYTKLFTMTKEITNIMLSQNNIVADLSLQFQCLETALKLLNEQIALNIKGVKIPEENVYALLHGFANGLIDSITEKINNKCRND